MDPGSTRSWLIALHTVFLPNANGLVLENPSEAMSKWKNTQESAKGSQKIEVEIWSKMGVEKSMSQEK